MNTIKAAIMAVVFTMVVNTMNAQTYYLYITHSGIKDSVQVFGIQNGYVSTDTVEVNVNEPFVVDASVLTGNQVGYGRTMQIGQIDSVFKNLYSINTTYNYIVPDTIKSEGVYTISISILQYGTSYFYIKATNPNTTGIKSISSSVSNLIAYPNPANTILNVEWLMINNATELQVLDVLGNVVIKHSSLNTNHFSLDVSGLESGVYFVRVGSSTRKFVKQ